MSHQAIIKKWLKWILLWSGLITVTDAFTVEFIASYNQTALDMLNDFMSLPLRTAVEMSPKVTNERKEQHYPIREAVQKVPDHKNPPRIHSDSRDAAKESYKVVCYVTNWSFYRRKSGKFTPENIQPELCTHIVYAFGSLHPDELTIMSSDQTTDIDNDFYGRITSHSINNKTKVMIAIGGWTDSAGDKYSRLVSNGHNRRKFINSVIAFMRRYRFQGLHVDWNYPVCWQARCSSQHNSDKTNFVKLIQELRSEFDKHDSSFVLAAGISGYKDVIDVAYDVLRLSELLDFVSVMSYDYHGAWENRTGHVSPLYQNPDDSIPYYNTDSTVSQLVQLGGDPNKLVIGVPFYGQSFTLNDDGGSVREPGEAGEYTQQPGILAYYEICYRINREGWKVGRNTETNTEPFAYKNEQWVGFDDRLSLRTKANYVKSHHLAGIAIWTIDLDDFDNNCCTGSYPLLYEINVVLERHPRRPDVHSCEKPSITTTTASVTPSTTTSTTTEIPEHEHSSAPSWIDNWTPVTQTSTTTTTTTTTPKTTSQIPTTTSITEVTKPWWPPSITPRPGIVRPTRPPYTSSSKPSTSKTTETYNPPDTDATESDACVSGSYYADAASCNSYYRCIHGKKKKQYCAAGLQWSHESQICDWPSVARCAERMGSGGKDHLTPVSTTTTTKKPTSTESWTIPFLTVIEGLDCSQGEYYAAKDDCTAFYTCNTGHLVKRHCPDNLRWNQNNRLCDWPYNVPCTNDIDQTKSNIIYRQIDLKNEDCSSGRFASHSDDCTKYYECLWGAYREYACPNGLYWNEKMMGCDWPSNTDCSKNPPQTIPSASFKPMTTPTTTSIWQTKSTAKSTTKSTTNHWTEITPGTWTDDSDPTTTENPWTWRPTFSTVTLPTKRPEVPLSGYYKVVCYFTNWAWYRPSGGKYFPEDVDFNLCTHVVYGFAVLDYSSLVIRVYDSWADEDNRFYERVVALKKRGIKVLIAIGGWNDSAGDKYSRLVNNPAARQAFISSVLRFIRKYGFDGLDLDWEYPKCWQVDCKKGPSSDKENFAALVRELRQAFDKYNYLLSSAVSPSKTVIDAGYDVKTLSDNLDWIAVMTYDYHGQWDKKTGHLAPIYYIPDDEFDYFNINYTINYWIEKGAKRRKLVMGMPMYGQAFTLADPSNHGLNAPSYGPAEAGKYTKAGGFLAYYEICEKVKNEGWTVVQDAKRRRGPYAYKGNQWVGYDDVRSIQQKVDLIQSWDLGGGMIWALDLDDFRGNCGQGLYPLLSTIAKGLATPDTGKVTTPSVMEHMVMSNETELISEVISSMVGSSTESILEPIEMVQTSTTDMESLPSNEVVSSSRPQENMTQAANDGFKIVCYFTNWAWYRQGIGKYIPTDVDTSLCTHIIYGFAVLHPEELVIRSHDPWADIDNGFYEKMTSLRNDGVKILLALGGWNDSADKKYSRLVNNKEARRNFVTHTVDFINKYKFDGLDLDWEYPKCWQVNCKKGPDSDKEGFSNLVTELREEFDKYNLLLSAAVSPNKMVIDAGYDVPVLSEKLDWISIMAYDYHGQWDKKTGHVAPMYQHPLDEKPNFNTNFSVHYWVEQGADRKKIVLGMPMYGQSFSLAMSKDRGLNSPTYGGGEAGDSTMARGFLAYYEICQRVQKRNWEVIYDEEGRIGPYATKGDQWVSFDDQAMIRHKSEYVLNNNLGGAMIWALDLDDFREVCGCGKYPLLKTINQVLRNKDLKVEDCYLEPESSSPPPERTLDRYILREPLFINSLQLYNIQCKEGEVKRHPTDCSRYIKCTDGFYNTEQLCPNGLHFNQKLKKCDKPDRSKCESNNFSRYHVLQNDGKSMDSATSENSEENKVILCYVTSKNSGKYKVPENAVDSNLCTHLIYAHVSLVKSPSGYVIDQSLRRSLKRVKEAGVGNMISIGGSGKYDELLHNEAERSRFIDAMIPYLKENEIDGIEIDWEFSKCSKISCIEMREATKKAFTWLVIDLASAFKLHDLFLSIAVSSREDIVDELYEVDIISTYVDWISLKTYHYHDNWKDKTVHISPLYPSSSENQQYSVDYTVSQWLNKGAPSHKLVLGIPFYGQTFKLVNPSDGQLGSKTQGLGDPLPFTNSSGFASFYEICKLISIEDGNVFIDKQGTYVKFDKLWISYNNLQQIQEKVKYSLNRKMGGVSVWSLDFDDFANICGCGEYPLLSAVNHVIKSDGLEISSDCSH